MQAQKIKVVITVETLSTDTVYGLVIDAMDAMQKEAENGKLQMDDGDCITWNTIKQPVQF